MKARQQESKDVVFNEVREANKRPIVPSCTMVEVGVTSLLSRELKAAPLLLRLAVFSYCERIFEK